MLAIVWLLLLIGLSELPLCQPLAVWGHCRFDFDTIRCNYSPGKDDRSQTLFDLMPIEEGLRRSDLRAETFKTLSVNCRDAEALGTEQKLTRNHLRQLTDLTSIVIIRCRIAEIESDAFESQRDLSKLDLSHNRLSRLPVGLLNGRVMQQLQLSGNRGLELRADAFADLRLATLKADSCELDQFPFASLTAITGLTSLILSNNRMQSVPIAARALVTRLRHFYIDGNPIVCTCGNRWLRESVNWRSVAPEPSQENSDALKVPSCQSPYNVMGVPITGLEPEKFVCRAPEIKQVRLTVGQDRTDLFCAANADLAETLTWTFGDNRDTFTGRTFSKILHRRPGFKTEKFDLTASVSDGQSANFSLLVTWQPLLSSQSPTASAADPASLSSSSSSSSSTLRPRGRGNSEQKRAPSSPSGANESSEEEAAKVTRFGHLQRKQFTLVELILAVAGTFMATSLIFLLTCQFCRWYGRRDKKRYAYGYAAQPYGYATQRQQQQQQQLQQQQQQQPQLHQQQMVTSHEYDVPRIDQPCLPKMAPVPQGELEFLDYTGHTMLYGNK